MYLQPGESRGVRFSVPGSWQMHCHPHPWMRSNVTVVDNYTGPAEVTVDIVDGTTSSEFHFVPENIVVAPGTVVVYHNAGNLPHSATSLFQDAPVKLLPLKDASGGTVTIDPNPRGWQRIRLFAWDATGRMGVANYDVYVSDLPVFQPKSVPISFHAGGLPSQAVQPSLSTILTTYNGTMFVNFTVKDAGGPAESAAGQNLAQVTVHVRSDTDIMTKEKASSGQMSARALAGLYTIEIDPVQGAEIDGTLTVEEAYDLTPPPPAPYVDPESIPHKH
jgi:plastocyanin